MALPIKLHLTFFSTAGLMLVSRGMSVALGVISARYLGPEAFGLYSFVIAIIVIIAIPVTSGLPILLVREVASFYAQAKWNLLLGVIYWSRAYVLLVSFVIVIGLWSTLSYHYFDGATSELLWFAAILIPLRGFLARQSALLNGFKRPVLAQFLVPDGLLVPAITLAILYLSKIFGFDFTSTILMQIVILASLLSFIAGSVILKSKVQAYTTKYAPEYTFRAWHKSLVPFTIMVFVGTLNVEVASIFLGGMVDHHSVAYFKVAMQAVSLIAIGLNAINTVIMPDVAQLYKQNNVEATQALLARSVRLTVLVSLPIILFLIIFGEAAIMFLFGVDYLPAYPIMAILLLGQLVNVSMGSVGLVLNMTGNEKMAAKSLIIALLLNVMMLFILVPIYGAIGAAVSVSTGLACWNLLMAVDVYKTTTLKTWIRINF